MEGRWKDPDWEQSREEQSWEEQKQVSMTGMCGRPQGAHVTMQRGSGSPLEVTHTSSSPISAQGRSGAAEHKLTLLHHHHYYCRSGATLGAAQG